MSCANSGPKSVIRTAIDIGALLDHSVLGHCVFHSIPHSFFDGDFHARLHFLGVYVHPCFFLKLLHDFVNEWVYTRHILYHVLNHSLRFRAGR